MKPTLPRVLIVDDDPANISILADILSPDHKTFAAKSGASALKRIRSGTRPDLILLDVRMPEMDGYQVCRKLRADPDTKGIPIIFITALSDDENETKGLELGAVDYISRPFNPAIVKARVKTHLFLAHVREASEDRYRALFANLVDGVVIVDESGICLEANDAFLSDTDRFREEILGKKIDELVAKSGCRGVLPDTGQISRKGFDLFETRMVRKNGSDFPVEVKTRPIEFDHMPAFLAVYRDISRRKEAEAEMRRYRDRLEDLLARRTEELEEKGRSLAELERELHKRRRFQNIVGKSEAMQTLFFRLRELADLFSTVLITGESGAGKDLAAEALHRGGVRNDYPLVRVACSDLSEGLIESELFGHVRGAFTGALQDRIGRFEKAGKGTLFLDEVGDIPPKFQQRLLRVLEKRSFERVGQSSSIPMEARIVAATNKNLAEMVKKGLFREDLYYRLKVVEIHLPALRERKEDIPLLAHHFLSVFQKQFKKQIREISPQAASALMAYPWPGNVRELRHVIENACINCRTNRITPADLPAEISSFFHSKIKTSSNPDDEYAVICRALEKSGGNKAKAARLLNISRQTLYRKLDRFSDRGLPIDTLSG